VCSGETSATVRGQDQCDRHAPRYATRTSRIAGNSSTCTTVRIPLGTLPDAPLPTLSCRLSAGSGGYDEVSAEDAPCPVAGGLIGRPQRPGPLPMGHDRRADRKARVQAAQDSFLSQAFAKIGKR
jgi:hypothetical protein